MSNCLVTNLQANDVSVLEKKQTSFDYESKLWYNKWQKPILDGMKSVTERQHTNNKEDKGNKEWVFIFYTEFPQPEKWVIKFSPVYKKM